ncbi:ABC transporter permease [Thermus thermophilus]|uniref:ABC transporter permease n=1 Tax=Thermus thermophilus TaxID=274 RepID=A0AAD1KXA0_THETH|nr:ABC transporter permease [Thermus thermophilus]BBL83134.1 ABC transporter permease [Thermus thermophilus]BBL85435.1 ABC transporter permease [Thermus thermophilus]BCZ87782.1 ABC transporter permease [Thermus thermophilus]BCZ90143.1 ABC transporter permease [Thermus thermophilus]BCZ92816.1 ABC transporter permease [Thermus thermophilus]
MELFLLVLRNLLARPVRSLLTLLGVLVATASMVLFLSFGEGLRRALFQELSRVGPAIQVVPEGTEGFVFGALPEIPPETLKALEEAGKALGVRAVVPTLFLTRGGFDPSTSFFFQGLPEGTPPDLLYPGLKAKEGRLIPSEKGAVLGAKVAERSGLALGSVLRLTPRLELRVEGVLEATGGLADNLIFVPLRAIQEALGTENVTAVLVALSPGQKAEAVARALEEAVPGVKAQTTSEVMRFAERALRISDLVRFGISLVALVVGGLLVANTVTMSVYERVREFGVMRALGARRGFIFRLVLLEALLIALLGGALGLGLGALGAFAINLYTLDQVGLALSAVTPRLALFALGVALGLGLLAGLLPAYHASRIPVVEALGRV